MIAAAGPAAAPPPAIARWPAAAVYRLQLRYRPRGGVLAGGERITFANTGPTPLRRVWLRLWPNGWHPVGTSGHGGGCRRPRVRLAGFRGGRPAGFHVGCSALAIALPTPLAPGARTTVSFNMTVRVPVANDRFGRQGRVALIGNAIPLLAVTDRTGTHLEPYSSRGETFFSLTSAWHVVLEPPARPPRGDHRRRARPRASRRRRPAAIEAPQRTRLRPRRRPVPPALDARADGVARARLRDVADERRRRPRRPRRRTAALVRTFDAWYGRYGAPELDVVLGDFTTFGGMEYPELVLTDP